MADAKDADLSLEGCEIGMSGPCRCSRRCGSRGLGVRQRVGRCSSRHRVG